MNQPTTPPKDKRTVPEIGFTFRMPYDTNGAQLFTLSSDRRSCRSTAFAFAPSTWVATKQPDVFGRLASGFKVSKDRWFQSIYRVG